MSTRANAIDLSGSDDETQKKRKPEVTEEKDKKSLRREKAKDRCFGCNKYRILNNDWQCRLCVIKKALTSQEERQDAEFDYDSAEDTCSLLGLRGSDQDTDSDSDSD